MLIGAPGEFVYLSDVKVGYSTSSTKALFIGCEAHWLEIVCGCVCGVQTIPEESLVYLQSLPKIKVL